MFGGTDLVLKVCSVGKCGAASLTQECLQNNLDVRRDTRDESDSKHGHVHIQEPNDILTHFCVCNGYGGNVFKGHIKKVSKQSSMVWHLTERDEKIQQATT